MVDFNVFHDVNLDIESFLQLRVKLPLKARVCIKIIKNESLSIKGINDKY
jgi:hypothetical protein